MQSSFAAFQEQTLVILGVPDGWLKLGEPDVALVGDIKVDRRKSTVLRITGLDDPKLAEYAEVCGGLRLLSPDGKVLFESPKGGIPS